jgi:hypothetical protein
VSINRNPERLDLEAAADLVALPPAAVQALVAAGYLAAGKGADGSQTFQLADLQTFVARNADYGSAARLRPPLLPELQPQELVALLDERAEHMALRLFKMYSVVFPAAADWPPRRQNRFVRITKERFEAILAIAALGDSFDDELVADLERIGASAADLGVELPQILTMLRVSRDLVVQNAIDLVRNDDREGGHALSLLLTRILPAMDRLGDALTAGYWAAMFPG